MTNRNDDEEFLNFLKTEISKKLIIQVYLNDIIGKVIYHIDKTVSIYPNDGKLINEVFKFPEEYLVKVFMPWRINFCYFWKYYCQNHPIIKVSNLDNLIEK